MEAFVIHDTTIRLQPTEPSGETLIRVQPTPFGQRLAQLLDGQPQANGDYVIRHTPEVDGRMLDVIDTLITLRYSQPGLVQLQLRLPETIA